MRPYGNMIGNLITNNYILGDSAGSVEHVS